MCQATQPKDCQCLGVIDAYVKIPDMCVICPLFLLSFRSNGLGFSKICEVTKYFSIWPWKHLLLVIVGESSTDIWGFREDTWVLHDENLIALYKRTLVEMGSLRIPVLVMWQWVSGVRGNPQSRDEWSGNVNCPGQDCYITSKRYQLVIFSDDWWSFKRLKHCTVFVL